METLATRFSGFCRQQGLDEELASFAWEKLEHLYGEAHRRYHDFGHIGTMLRSLDELPLNDPAIEWAIWFHDAVYDPRSSTNEEASAELFEEMFEVSLPSEMVKSVTRLIMATKPSAKRVLKEDERILSDLDLLVLSRSWEDYLQYTVAIREEYAHVSDEAFVAGRVAVMSSFLNGPIYLTAPFQVREAQARSNIMKEIAILEKRSKIH